MKRTFWSRTRAAVCCAAFCLAALLAGCTAAANTSPASTEALSQAPASEAVPSGEDDTTTAPAAPVDDEENGIAFTDPADAFAGVLGWGPGTAGTSLKMYVAAASMMDWAGENHAAARSAASVSECLEGWYDGLEAFDQENFAEAWPLIQDAAQQMLDDPDGAAPMMEDAGVDEAPDCSAEDWAAVAGALNRFVPAPLQ